MAETRKNTERNLISFRDNTRNVSTATSFDAYPATEASPERVLRLMEWTLRHLKLAMDDTAAARVYWSFLGVRRKQEVTASRIWACIDESQSFHFSKMHQYLLREASHHPQVLFPSFVVFDPASCHGIWPPACPKRRQGKWELRYGEMTIPCADRRDTGLRLRVDVDMSSGYHMGVRTVGDDYERDDWLGWRSP